MQVLPSKRRKKARNWGSKIRIPDAGAAGTTASPDRATSNRPDQSPDGSRDFLSPESQLSPRVDPARPDPGRPGHRNTNVGRLPWLSGALWKARHPPFPFLERANPPSLRTPTQRTALPSALAGSFVETPASLSLPRPV